MACCAGARLPARLKNAMPLPAPTQGAFPMARAKTALIPPSLSAVAATLTRNQVAALCGVNPGTIDNWEQTNPLFPRGVRLSRGCVRWRAADIERFLTAAQAEGGPDVPS